MQRLFPAVVCHLISLSYSLAATAQLPWETQSAEVSLQISLDEVGNEVRGSLARADNYLRESQWSDAVESIRRAIVSGGSRVIAVDETARATSGFRRYVTTRRYGQMWLAKLGKTHPEALAVYRQQIDPLADRWLREAIVARDDALLRRVVDQAFVSRAGDDALWLLGEYALGRGHYNAARDRWSRLSPALRTPHIETNAMFFPDAYPLWLTARQASSADEWNQLTGRLSESMPSNWLVYPDTDKSLADIRARLVLVSIMEGSPQRTAQELALYRRLHPDARGTIGGESGNYGDLLSKLLAKSRTWAQPELPDHQWPTLGGAQDRQARVDYHIDPAMSPEWQIDLPRIESGAELLTSIDRRASEASEALLGYHPVIVQGMAVVQTGPQRDHIVGIDIKSGEIRFGRVASPSAQEVRPHTTFGRPARADKVGVPRYTLNAVRDVLFARTGSATTTEPALPAESRGHDDRKIVALGLGARGKLLMQTSLDAKTWGPGWVIEGVPVSNGIECYVALRRNTQSRTESFVACFDISDGRLCWRSQMLVGAVSVGGGTRQEATHSLLTLSEETLYFNTNLGVIASLRVSDGHLNWITGYPRSPYFPPDPDRLQRHYFRDLVPCLVHQDMVICAPADCDRIFALDGSTGHVIWSTRPQVAVDAVHLLGVADARLIVSGDYLYWIDIHDGRLTGQFPSPGEDALRGFGRGVVAGGNVYWPTREKIYVLGAAHTRQIRQPINLAIVGISGGHLVVGEDALLIASDRRLVCLRL